MNPNQPTVDPRVGPAFEMWTAYRQAHGITEPLGPAGKAVAVDERTGEVFIHDSVDEVFAAAGPLDGRRLVFIQFGRIDHAIRRLRLRGRWRRLS
jgi:hypothetical protein